MATRALRKADERETRDILLKAAGRVFAEKGFDRATGKEICARAGANTAAVNYYFGGIDGLYAEVLRHAHQHIVTVDRLQALVASKPDPRGQLEAIINMIVGVITGPESSSWMFRVLGREIVAPSAVFGEMRDKEIFPKMRVLKSVVAELTGLPEAHPAIERSIISIIAPCILLLIGDRRFFKLTFPKVGYSAQEAPAVVRHLVDFALAGIEAIARSARKKN